MGKKKTISVFLIAGIFLIPGICSLLLTAIVQFRHYRMEQELEYAHVQSIEMKKENVIWLRNGKEALIAGMPFDVRSFHFKDANTMIISGIFDETEKKLLDILTKQETGSRERAVNLALLLLIPAAGTAENIEIRLPVVLRENSIPGNNELYPNPSCLINTPPPEYS